jgi:hypothetical protein
MEQESTDRDRWLELHRDAYAVRHCLSERFWDVRNSSRSLQVRFDMCSAHFQMNTFLRKKPSPKFGAYCSLGVRSSSWRWLKSLEAQSMTG